MTSSLIAHTDTAVSPALSKALQAHTARAHEDAEQVTFINELLRGELDIGAFIRLQEQSWLFYSALEAAVRQCLEDPRSQPLLDVRLEREHTLAHDLDALHGSSSWRENIRPTPATAAYVQRLEEIAANRDLPRVIAHHYVRYLGDLSGGQIIARMVGKHYGVGQDALSFYRFNELGKLKPYKDNYRAALDALVLAGGERNVLLNEAHQVFILNQNVFNSLA